MNWPLSQDFNEAVQNPASGFADPDLKAGRPVVGPVGVPMPRSGNFADVYAFAGPDGRKWAVKCFTRPVAAGLDARYAAIAAHIATAGLPFTVGFDFLRQGIRVKGRWLPVVKMPWVDGVPINQFVAENLGRATPLEAMLTLWTRLCRKLRESGMAHCDLQHGNVLLVPAGGKQNALGLKLVDYDGMFVPSLAGQPTGEAGHAAYQHPERVTRNVYSADLDRFPHLVVATALRGLLVGGESLWKTYDNGDNLLFGEKDFRDPSRSKLMRELWDTGDPFTVGLVGHLALACGKPMAAVPWLDQLMPDGRPPTLTPSQERQAADLLGTAAVSVPDAPPFAITPGTRPAPAGRVQSGRGLLAAAVGGGLLTIGVLTGAAIFVSSDAGKKKSPPADVAKTDPPAPDTPKAPDPVVKPAEPPAVAVKPPAPPAVVAKPPETPPAAVKPPEPVKVTAVPAAPKELWAVAATDDPTKTAAGVKFTPDGSKLVAPERGSNAVRAFDAAAGKPLGVFREFPTALNVVVAPLPGGKILAAGNESFLLVFDAATGKATGKVVVPNPLPRVDALSVSRSGRLALLVGRGPGVAPGKAVVLDVETGAEVLSKDTGPPAAAALSPDGTLVAITDPAGKVQLWSLQTRTLIGPAKNRMPVAAAQAYAPTRKLLAVRPAEAAGRVTGDIHILDTVAGQQAATINGDYARGGVTFSADARFLFAATGQTVEVWDTGKWEKAATITVPRAAVTAFDVSPDGRKVAVLAADGKLRLFDLVAEQFVSTLPNAPEPAAMMEAKPARRPVPDDAALAKADALVKATYKDDFAKKATADRRKFADKLLKDAGDTADMAGRYVMIREALAAATETADLPLGLRAADALDADYDVDGFAQKMLVFEKVTGVAVLSPALKEVAAAAAELADDLADKDEYEKAAKLFALAAAAVTKANLSATARDYEAKAAVVRKRKDEFEPVKAAAATLKLKPEDPAAATVVGKFRCFAQRRWDDGLPLLAMGDDAALKALADGDLKAATDPESSDVKRGDAWSDYAAARPEADRPPLKARANYWYAKALSSLKGGLEKAAAMNKLAFTAGGVEYRPGLVCEVFTGPGLKTKRLGRLDMGVDGTVEEFRPFAPEVRVTWTGVIVPPVAGQYTLLVDTKDYVVVRLGVKPDEKKVIEALRDPAKRETKVRLTDRPTAIVVEFGNRPRSTTAVRFKWVRPGAAGEELVPPECLFHAKKDESLVTEK